MKSKLSIKSILIIAIIGMISLVYFNPSFAADTAKISVETANIRKTPDVSSTILEQASKGEKVQIIEKSGEWYKIKYNGIQGYLRKDLLDLEEEATTENTNTVSNETQNTEVENTTQTNTNTETNTISDTENKQGETTTSVTEVQNENTETTGMYTCKENAKLKIMPLIIGNDIKEINKDTTINVLEINNKWALIESGTDRGWILISQIEKVSDQVGNASAEPVAEEKEQPEEKQESENPETKQEEQTQNKEKVQEVTMYVNSEVVNLRKSESTSSESLAKLAKGTQVTVTSENNGWSKVKVNSKEGYIASSLLSKTKPEVVTSRRAEEPRQDVAAQNNNQNVTTSTQETQASKQVETTSTQTETSTTSSSKGQEVCNYARQFLGCRYVYGGTTPSGFDCSGFTQYVYKHFGVTLNRTAEAQASNGTAVSKSNLKAGDLLIFTSHAGIYLGNGTFIHAANSKKGVIITSLSDSYYVKNYITARRIFN